MAITFTENTQIIFFDLEFVSKGQRAASLPSLRYNPFNPGHTFLGGVLERQYPKNPEKEKERKEFWLWENDDNEKQLIQLIFNYFKESWQSLERETPEHMDLITCGIGIARTDIPVLLSVALKHKIANEEEIFEYLAKTKILDFTNIFIPYVGPSTPLYPVPKTKILRKCNIPPTFDTGDVGELYDAKKYTAIEERVNKEVDDIIGIYDSVRLKLELKKMGDGNKGRK